MTDVSHASARGIKFLQPPVLYDNLKRLDDQYDARLRQYQAHRTWLLNTLTTASFFGGLGLILLVALLGVLRIVSGWHLWIPAVGVTACCLIIGAVLIDPSRLRPDGTGLVAFASYQPAAEEELERDNVQEQDRANASGVRQGQAIQPRGASANQERKSVAGSPAPPAFAAPAAPGEAPRSAKPEFEQGGSGGEKQTVESQARADSPPSKTATSADRATGNRQPGKAKTGEDSQAAILRAGAGGERPNVKTQLTGRRHVEALSTTRALQAQQDAAQVPKSTDILETVFWHPLLDTGAEGRVKVAFRLPDRPGLVRLRIDAHCQGRVGVLETDIVVAAHQSDQGPTGDDKAGR